MEVLDSSVDNLDIIHNIKEEPSDFANVHQENSRFEVVECQNALQLPEKFILPDRLNEDTCEEDAIPKTEERNHLTEVRPSTKAKVPKTLDTTNPMKKRAQWSEEQMKSAVSAVLNGMSVRLAAAEHNIPRTTLRNRVTSGKTNRKLGRSSTLTKEQQQDLCSRIYRSADVGMPITSKVLRKSVFTYCEENKIKNPFNVNENNAGRKWLESFLNHNPEVAALRTQNLYHGRAPKLNKIIVSDYFKKLRQVILDIDVADKPHNIYIIGENVCRLTLNNQQILARKDVKRFHLVAPEHAENVTLVSCGNAAGQTVPPMILFKSKTLKQDWVEHFPRDTKIVITTEERMTSNIFVHWVDHFVKFKITDDPTLLIFDSTSSHLDVNIVATAERHNITLLFLPSNTTHELHPLDKFVFKTFDSYWDDNILKWCRTRPERSVSRSDFGKIFAEVWSNVMTPKNVLSGFRATGIYPFNPEAIPDIAFVPVSLPESENEVNESVQCVSNDHAHRGLRPNKNKHQHLSLLSDDSSCTESDYGIHDSSNDALPLIQSASVQEIPCPSSIACKSVEHISNPNITSTYVHNQVSSPETVPVLNTNVSRSEKDNSKVTTNFPHQSTSGTRKRKPFPTSGKLCFICEEDRLADVHLCARCRKCFLECVGSNGHG